MSAYITIGRRLGCAALGIAVPLAVLMVSNGFAAAAPRAPLPTDEQAPAIPFDPGALVSAIDNYAELLSILTGGRRTQPSLGVPGGVAPAPIPAPAPAPADPYPMIPGVPYVPGQP